MKIEDNNICFVRFFFASYEINCAKGMHKMDEGRKKRKTIRIDNEQTSVSTCGQT